MIAIVNSCCSLPCVTLLFCVLMETRAFVHELITSALHSSQPKACISKVKIDNEKEL